jgi:hypothetical protein
MERTSGMVLSQEEKEQYRREELGKRAKGLRIKLLDSDQEVDQVLDSLNEEPVEDRKLLESLLWDEMIESLSTDKDALRQLLVMEKLPQSQNRASELAQIRNMLKAGLKSRTKDRKKIVARERKRLAAFGLSGTAVVPKIPDDAILDSEAASRIEELKNLLREKPVD